MPRSAPADYDFDFDLPPQLIAQHPLAKRDGGRLLYVDDRVIYPFSALTRLLKSGDLLVFNTSKVIPARLLGHKESGGKVEILLERLLDHSTCLAQIKSSKPLKKETLLMTPGGDFIAGEKQERFYHLQAIGKNGRKVSIYRRFLQHGKVPLPPYIRRLANRQDRRRYQTVYACEPGSVAAPTAGLHFSKALLSRLEDNGINHTSLYLHVGAGTFAPLEEGQTTLHSEQYRIEKSTAHAVRQTKKNGGRVVAVGTTALRALESAADDSGNVTAATASTSLFIRPGYTFRVADMLITNFHLPRSSLFMLVCAFGGSAKIQAAYRQAIAARMRFYSYGDAMLLTAA